jgi:hypothetical protein
MTILNVLSALSDLMKPEIASANTAASPVLPSLNLPIDQVPSEPNGSATFLCLQCLPEAKV